MGGARFHLTFPERLREEPVIYRLGHEFGLVTNIHRANIDERFGWAIVEMQGSEDRLRRALEWLAELGVDVERIDQD